MEHHAFRLLGEQKEHCRSTLLKKRIADFKKCLVNKPEDLNKIDPFHYIQHLQVEEMKTYQKQLVEKPISEFVKPYKQQSPRAAVELGLRLKDLAFNHSFKLMQRIIDSELKELDLLVSDCESFHQEQQSLFKERLFDLTR